MEKKEFQELAEKISKGLANIEEVAKYNYYYKKFEVDREEDIDFSNDEVGDEIFERINDKIFIRPKNSSFKSFIKIAAVIVLMIGAGLSYFFNSRPKKSISDKLVKNEVQDVDPGENRAVLILSDGSSVDLGSAHDGTLAKQGDVKISKNDDGEVVYSGGGNNGSDKTLFNIIKIPRGGHYKLTLPDGTKVWLNSSSLLKFPVSFVGNKREVELEGEAYFEVAKVYINKHKRMPFIVKSRSQEIEVLGTWFNVNAYEDEKEVVTTLLEGAVKIKSSKTGVSKVLKPGEQVLVHANGDLKLNDNIDQEEVLAWKNNMFYFNNTDLRMIMRQLSRWYDVEIDYEGMPENKKFNGVLSKDSKLSKVLKIMEASSNLKFKIYEEKISLIKQ